MSKFDIDIVDATSSTCDGDAKYNARYILREYKHIIPFIMEKNSLTNCRQCQRHSIQYTDQKGKCEE